MPLPADLPSRRNAALIAYAGWRAMVLILAGNRAHNRSALLLLMRDHPQDLGLFAYGDTTARPSLRGTAVIPWRGIPRAMGWARVRDFWLISGGYFVCGASRWD